MNRTRQPAAALAATFLMVATTLAAPPLAGAADELFGPVRARVTEASAELDHARGARMRAPLLLETGAHDEAAGLVPELLKAGVPGRILAARTLLAVSDYAALRPVLEGLAADAPQDPGVRDLLYRWWAVEDDLARVDSTRKAREAAGDQTFPDRLAAARIRAMLLDNEGAKTGYQDALGHAADAADSARALRGLGDAEYQLRDYDGALSDLTTALALSGPDPDLLMSAGETLIRLGRTDEAIDAAELAVKIAPYHERAHYYLGNGYARKNYTQLFAAYPGAFADSAGTAALHAADSLLAAGHPEEARAGYRAVAGAHPGWADVWTRLGSMDWDEGRYEDARAEFGRSLADCPEYGRAHNGMAKALEAERLEIEVHLPGYETAFAAAPMPDVPGIETFVENWKSLSPRHRKRVALSIAPWKRFIPVLVASGETYYIKPLYELLSETPGQEVLRDQRISYDSRLWDDVRGCGGYHTVTGVEDVERTVHDRYNTVLHELTHQVHGVLPAERKRAIQELYRRAKERDDKTGDAFLSRYAGGSVWEYFAEGANSYESPRRDDYDTRDIVKERLQEKDPDLERLVVEIMNRAGVDSCYAVGFTNRGDDQLERGDADAAIASYGKALERSPGEETATGSLIYALEVAGRTGPALDLAGKSVAADRKSASLVLRHADALWHGGRGLDAAIDALRRGRGEVREEERYQVDLALGRLLWTQGDAAGAEAAYRRVLGYQSDSPEGLWGLASALALGGEQDSAWVRYEAAVRIRTGVVDLRNDYARDLLNSGRVERAQQEIQAALLLDPEDPTTLALEGWAELETGDAQAALATCEKAVALAPWCDLAVITKARAQAARGDAGGARATAAPLRERISGGAPPGYVYREKWGRYDEIHTLPAVERSLLAGVE